MSDWFLIIYSLQSFKGGVQLCKCVLLIFLYSIILKYFGL